MAPGINRTTNTSRYWLIVRSGMFFYTGQSELRRLTFLGAAVQRVLGVSTR